MILCNKFIICFGWLMFKDVPKKFHCLLTNFRNRFTSLQRSAPEYAKMLQSAMKDEFLGPKKTIWIGNLLMEMSPYMINDILDKKDILDWLETSPITWRLHNQTYLNIPRKSPK